MRVIVSLALAAIALTGCATTPPVAAPNPFEITANKDNPGIVIVAVDDAVPTSEIAQSFRLDVIWFDAAKKMAHIQAGDFSRSYLHLVTDADGHRFLIGQIGEGEAVIPSYFSQQKWGLCYNAGTYHFFVKGGAYNFIGRFDDGPSYKALDDAITAGKLPATVTDTDAGQTLFDQTLSGFAPGENRIGDKDRAAALFAAKLGHPVEIITPTLVRTEMNLSNGPDGKPRCYDYSQDAADRPDRSQPAPIAPPVAPVVPTANDTAKPASAITWVSRPKVP